MPSLVTSSSSTWTSWKVLIFFLRAVNTITLETPHNHSLRMARWQWECSGVFITHLTVLRNILYIMQPLEQTWFKGHKHQFWAQVWSTSQWHLRLVTKLLENRVEHQKGPSSVLNHNAPIFSLVFPALKASGQGYFRLRWKLITV